MPALLPIDAVIDADAVVDVLAILLLANCRRSVGTGKDEDRVERRVVVRNTRRGCCQTGSESWREINAVRPVIPKVEMVQKCGCEREVPTTPNIVGRKILDVTVVVEWLRETGAGSFLEIFACAVGDKDLIPLCEILIDADRIRRVDVRRAGSERIVVCVAKHVGGRGSLVGSGENQRSTSAQPR